MKTDTRHQLSKESRRRLIARLIGITALLLAGFGTIYLASVIPNWEPETLLKVVKTEFGKKPLAGLLVLFGGATVALLALAFEVRANFSGGNSSRGAAGVSSTVQIALAAALLIAINVYGFLHETDFDLTNNKQFTLPEKVADELTQLKSETTIVVLQQHKTFGRLTDKPDRFDYAAERKVVEKVFDLVDLFRKFGPQFKVVVLDVEEQGYDKKLAALTKENPPLLSAIQAAPENSIFFASEGKVQRMSFNEFYQLDRAESKKGTGNLVLQPQGLAAFVKRITAIEEKRPKIAVAVAHEWLTTQVTEGQEQFTLAGLRKSLTSYGFDVVDVVIKRGSRDPGGEAASFTYQETKLIRLERELELSRRELNKEKRFTEKLVLFRSRLNESKDKPLDERIKVCEAIYIALVRRPSGITAQDRKDEATMRDFESFVLNQINTLEARQKKDEGEAQDEFNRIDAELTEIRKQERALEDRYMTDVKPKFTRLLAECDMVIIPRMTIINPTIPGGVLPSALHKIDSQQADVLRDFMKSGKPILVCAGPTNEPSIERRAVSDDLEALLGDRGIELGSQTILFNSESKAFRDAQSGDQLGGSAVKIPPFLFSPPPDDQQVKKKLKPNPIALALQVIGQGLEKPLEIQARALRPVSLKPAAQAEQPFAAPFIWTSQRSWSESYPFNYTMRFIPQAEQEFRVPVPAPRLDDDAKDEEGGMIDTANKERAGPFSIAVAVDSTLPRTWYSEQEWKTEDAKPSADRTKSRLVVLGHGGLFSKPELSPATEQLLLTMTNWLLKREDRLAHDADPQAPTAIDRPWKYPRVEMSEGRKALWHWGTFIGLPAIFVYLGLIVLMIRKVR
ncbi:MAG: hypothetical protein K8T89_09145 [Planctomycetes bacterium]|nr:hypothetical protein [Planctomycetota bacterium]